MNKCSIFIPLIITFNLLKYYTFQVNGTDFKPLQRCATKYLCVPATSVPSERIFSKAGQIVSDKRSRIKPKNVDMLLFISQNKFLYK